MKKPMIIVVGPSGAGKSSFVDLIVEEIKSLRDTVTYTTRPMRSGEKEGVPYHFVSDEEFRKRIAENFFVEWAEVHGRLYGTPYHQLEEAWKEGKAVIMDVDVQGAKTFKNKFPEALTVFINPPSIDELRRRVLARDGDTVKDLDLRMKNAQNEMAQANQFDVQITNDSFSKSYTEFKKVVEDLLLSY